jgi:hypothetical protein
MTQGPTAIKYGTHEHWDNMLPRVTNIFGTQQKQDNNNLKSKSAPISDY